MGNKNSASSKAKYDSQGPKIASTQPQHYDAPNPTKSSRKKKGLRYPTPQQHGKPIHVGKDKDFAAYIEDAKVKMRSKSNVGVHDDQSNAIIPVAVVNETNNTNKENEHFSDFIQNTRKKLRTITKRTGSIRRG
ncbi:hypothetical protein VNO78_21267 [Psophocarpus tetragonolobus]|uniref:Uncharacterized protein n=1 Tax=Psophocarpus tetragonolobus TaxID=3891 RepID=A0AAN9SCG6_PSOTE